MPRSASTVSRRGSSTEEARTISRDVAKPRQASPGAVAARWWTQGPLETLNLHTWGETVRNMHKKSTRRSRSSLGNRGYPEATTVTVEVMEDCYVAERGKPRMA